MWNNDRKKWYRPDYDDDADYNTNSESYYKYAGKLGNVVNKVIDRINLIFDSFDSIKIGDSKTIDSKISGTLEDKNLTLTSEAKVSATSDNGLGVVDDGLYAKNFQTDISDIYDKLSLSSNMNIVTKQKWDATSNTLYFVTKINKNDNNGHKVKVIHGFGNNGYNKPQQTASDFNELNPKYAVVSNFSPVLGGVIIQDGIILSDTQVAGCEIFAVNADGYMTSYPTHTSAQKVLADGNTDAWTGYYTIVKDGLANDISYLRPENEKDYDYLHEQHPRKIIGQDYNGNYIIITSDGRHKNSKGFTLDDATRVAQSEGCRIAFNADGGGSANTIVNGKKIGALFDNYGRTERLNTDFIAFTSDTNGKVFEREAYAVSEKAMTTSIMWDYDMYYGPQGLVNVTRQPSYIPLADSFVTFDRKLQYRLLNGTVQIWGRLLINPTITDTSVVHGPNYPIAENIDFGINDNTGIVFNAIATGDQGSGGTVKLAWDPATKNIYIYEQTDKIKKLVLDIKVSLPQFDPTQG